MHKKAPLFMTVFDSYLISMQYAWVGSNLGLFQSSAFKQNSICEVLSSLAKQYNFVNIDSYIYSLQYPMTSPLFLATSTTNTELPLFDLLLVSRQ